MTASSLLRKADVARRSDGDRVLWHGRPKTIFLTIAFAQVSDFFLSPLYLAFAAAFTLWPLANILLIRRLPPAPPAGVHLR